MEVLTQPRCRPGSQSDQAICPGSRERSPPAPRSPGWPRLSTGSRRGQRSISLGRLAAPGGGVGTGLTSTQHRLRRLGGQTGSRSPGHRTQGEGRRQGDTDATGYRSARRGAPPPSTGWRRRPELTAAGPVGLLPAAAPVQGWGRRKQADGLFQDARRGPAAGRAVGGGRSPRDLPPSWHKGYWKGERSSVPPPGRGGCGRGALALPCLAGSPCLC